MSDIATLDATRAALAGLDAASASAAARIADALAALGDTAPAALAPIVARIEAAAADGTLAGADAAAVEALVDAFHAGDRATLEAQLNDTTVGAGEAGETKKSWFAALAEALGEMLDAKAGEIEGLAGNANDDSPSSLIELNRAVGQFGFQSGQASTAVNGAADALKQVSKSS
jgi:ParB-like chromosome segregation protein Spo0J